ncbi:MAG TPA: hypothetical protein VHH11_11670 [Gammaproteobacteria bacterium]|nr:hypothetical protein [Gammaproteobacteria bacterium]
MHDGVVVGGVDIRFHYEFVVAEMGGSTHRRLWGECVDEVHYAVPRPEWERQRTG